MIRTYSVKSTIAIFFLGSVLAFTSCKSNVESTQKKEENITINPDELVGEETALLLAYLNELGDYVNSRNFPSLIKASSVFEELNGNQLIIDIRTPEMFSKGYIKGAKNIAFEDLPEYFESKIVPFEYDKIIVVSEDGQASSYATCLLRLMGYGNTYSMRWGMSGWNNEFAKEYWLKAISSEFQDMLDTSISDKNRSQELPELKTGKITGEEILLSRAYQLFSEGLEPAHITTDILFSNLGNYYIMNYIRRDKYEAGHIPGAIRYKPQSTLGIVSQMSTISIEKKSVVYCGTGHNSGFVTAYLRLFGFDASTLMYGNNSFMYNKMVDEQSSLSWLPFTEKEVEDYPYIR